ncbi:hypothetical protein CCAX7_27760 [Capsulimonas corticalis]|uniref:Uncharacterized protein n=1 Tax=Capsulimonas corticalis TaxID=2219043 RepID=A0A402CTI9_9BACT|nr:hypothetical protein CCAX7_27760 [Capsulimonas corticalis]
MAAWKLAVGVTAFLAAVPAMADIPGEYTTTQRVDGGAVKYTLKLNDNGDAELISEKQDSPRLDWRNKRDYGDILDRIDRDGKAVHAGKWRRSRDQDFTVSFDRLRYGSRSDSEWMFTKGNVDGDRVSLDGAKRSLYGERTDFRFSRVKGRSNNNGLIIGAAMLALGAIIALNSNKHHDSSHQEDFKDLTTESNGKGE